MRTIIAGSRTINNMQQLVLAIDETPWVITSIISGGAQGVDTLAFRFARDWNIPMEVYYAEWDKHGRSAGYKRNELMAKKADALLAIWDGKSRGTKHMINIARAQGLHVYVKEVLS